MTSVAGTEVILDPSPMRDGEDVVRIQNRGELSVEAGQLRSVHDVRAVLLPVVTSASECRSGIGDDSHLESEVRRHARGGGDTVISGETGNHQRFDSTQTEIRLELGADERAVHILLEQWLAIDGLCLVLDGVSRQAGSEQGLRLSRHVLDVNYRLPRLPPRGK